MKNPMTWLILNCGAINFSIYFIIQSIFGKKILEDFVKMSSAQSATTIFALTIVCISVLFLSSTFCRIIHNRRKPIIIFFSLLCFLVTVMMCIGSYCKPSAILFVTGYILYAVCGGVLYNIHHARTRSQQKISIDTIRGIYKYGL